jgi:hypothetical protein
MADRTDGGAAFPQEIFNPLPGGGGYRESKGGMSLRDYFAGQAPAIPNTFLHRPMPGWTEDMTEGEYDELVRAWQVERAVVWATRFADALLTARKEGGG